MSIKNKIKAYISLKIARERLFLNLKHRNKTLLERFRKITILFIFCLLIWIINSMLVDNLFGSRTISISNPVVVSAVAEASSVESEEQVASSYEVQDSTNDIESLIRQIFGEKAEEALKVARCESNLEPYRIGDTHLAFKKNGEELGKSYGVFQIRSGGLDGRGWSRPAKLGITLEEFEEMMLDPVQNIKYAKQIYDIGEWNSWTCKKVLVSVYN